ncbi:hypothetical protein KIH86_07500 [Paenibacillus sp. HN-1]|uniref:hypothetical protein n=1 Tax=Paenibacillus TaxID=44249 RepID=UPI001CA8DB91|nr:MULTISPECIES: hypothetical protein [Paenibacillus]MBY9080982.1 hypothetical protein [Paenibacillus sp. CGMCC 1.18879]MBY9084084.1 hypothetical protein [Paenibacillus sinensis]
MRILRWLSPRRLRDKEKELVQASGRVTVTIARYKYTSKEIQEEIKRNRFAPFLIYDRGEQHGGQ